MEDEAFLRSWPSIPSFGDHHHHRALPWRWSPTSSLPPMPMHPPLRPIPIVMEEDGATATWLDYIRSPPPSPPHPAAALPVPADHRRRRREPEPADAYDDDAVRFGYRSIPGWAAAPPRKRQCVPASTKAILGLQVVTASTDQNHRSAANACAICLEDLFHVHAEVEETTTTTTKVRAMPCSHAFHQHCIFGWLRCNSACPLCRHQLPTEEEEEWEEGERRIIALTLSLDLMIADQRRREHEDQSLLAGAGDGEESGEFVWVDGPVIVE